MRANGVAEKYITGDATPYEKFLAWARTVPYTLRNPLYHWTHLELQRYFGITELLDEKSAPSIWERANAALQGLTTQAILQKFDVEVVCTTDDPTDDLRHHQAIAKSNLPDASLSGFPSGQSSRHWRRQTSSPGSTSLRKLANVEVQNLTTLARSAAEPARVFPFPGLPPLRPRIEPLLRDAVFRPGRGEQSSRRRAKASPSARKSTISLLRS